jgi:hypothetical protein
MERPGWGGFFIAIFSSSSMVINQIHIKDIAILKPKDYPPVSRNLDTPESL